jgi:ATP-dependent helicase IRC3
VQTIGRKGSTRLAQFEPMDFDMLVIDEAHHATATSYQNVIKHFSRNPSLLLLGTTATPNRADGEGLNQAFEEIVDDKDILFGINGGWLADLRGIRIQTGSNLDGVHKVAGDFDLGELACEVNAPARNDLIVREWMKHAQSRKTVAFCVDVAHTKALALAFKSYGILAEAVWGDDPLRDQKLADHRAGSLTVLTNCGILTEGYDDPGIGCIIMARPTGSEGLYTQILGRGTRIPEGVCNLITARRAGIPIIKDDCVVLDFVDATARHSLVSLASLFGMPKADLKGRKITEVIAQIAAVKKANPYLDISKIEDASKISGYAQAVDLFKVSYRN